MSQVFQGRVFGRVYVPDARNARFPVLATLDPSLPPHKYHAANFVLNQGATPMCVAFSSTGYRMAGPISYKIDYSIPELYTECQKNDPWFGENYAGTSVGAALKVFKRRGYITEYRWATRVEQVIAHVLSTGPMFVGTTFYEGMANPDKKGFMRISGASVGGHAYLIIGANTKLKCPDGTVGAFRILNSWGRTFGQNGRAWLSFADFAVLLADDGEAATAIETPKGKA